MRYRKSFFTTLLEVIVHEGVGGIPLVTAALNFLP
jgi:hypothetical protein